MSDIKSCNWKEVKNYEGLYEVSDTGLVRIIKNKKILKQPLHKDGYYRVRLHKHGKQKSFMAHRLVALNFIDLKDGKYFINHIDGNKINNHISNLEWCTRLENASHALSLNLYSTGVSSGRAKLSLSDLKEIKQLQSQGVMQKDIAKKFNVARQAIARLTKGIAYKNDYINMEEL